MIVKSVPLARFLPLSKRSQGIDYFQPDAGRNEHISTSPNLEKSRQIRKGDRIYGDAVLTLQFSDNGKRCLRVQHSPSKAHGPTQTSRQARQPQSVAQVLIAANERIGRECPVRAQLSAASVRDAFGGSREHQRRLGSSGGQARKDRE